MDHTDPILINQALSFFVKKTRRDLEGERSWIRQPNNLISLVAIVISILGVVYGFYKDWNDGNQRDLQSLLTVVSDITKTEIDFMIAVRPLLQMQPPVPGVGAVSNPPTPSTPQPALPPLNNTAVPDPVVPNAIPPVSAPIVNASSMPDAPQSTSAQIADYGRAFGNRRVALLAEADRLINNLGIRAPTSQLLVLATAYAQNADYDKAEGYFRMIVEGTSRAVMQIAGWKSLGILYFNRGPAYYGKARDAFESGERISPNSQDLGYINSLLSLYQARAEFELSSPTPQFFLDTTIKARTLIASVPCAASHAILGAQSDDLFQRGLAAIQTPLDATAQASVLRYRGLKSADTCH